MLLVKSTSQENSLILSPGQNFWGRTIVDTWEYLGLGRLLITPIPFFSFSWLLFFCCPSFSCLFSFHWIHLPESLFSWLRQLFFLLFSFGLLRHYDRIRQRHNLRMVHHLENIDIFCCSIFDRILPPLFSQLIAPHQKALRSGNRRADSIPSPCDKNCRPVAGHCASFFHMLQFSLDSSPRQNTLFDFHTILIACARLMARTIL